MIDKLKYLNDKLNDNLNNNSVYNGPKYLYKYRPYDKYTFDMLENNYVFLCKVSNLDDKSECDVSLDIYRLFDLYTNNAKKECINQIISKLIPYTSKENYEIIKNKIYSILDNNGNVKKNYMLDLSFEIEEKCPGIDVASFVNWIINIPEKIDNSDIKSKIDKFIEVGIQAKEKLGICSLCDSFEIDELWTNYADHDSGYCIEYDVSDYDMNEWIFPVVYTDDRKNNLVEVLVEKFINQCINFFSNGEMKTDQTQYLRLFLTKNTEWNYQNEWRLIGDANYKMRAPKITKIIVGSKMAEENYNRINDFCCKNNIILKKR